MSDSIPRDDLVCVGVYDGNGGVKPSGEFTIPDGAALLVGDDGKVFATKDAVSSEPSGGTFTVSVGVGVSDPIRFDAPEEVLNLHFQVAALRSSEATLIAIIEDHNRRPIRFALGCVWRKLVRLFVRQSPPPGSAGESIVIPGAPYLSDTVAATASTRDPHKRGQSFARLAVICFLGVCCFATAQARTSHPPPEARAGQATDRPLARVIFMKVTAYCTCEICCEKKPTHPLYGITASGKPVTYNRGKFCAADKSIPFGTMIAVPGYNGGKPVPVIDRGGAIKGKHIDLYFPSHSEARRWGVKYLNVTVYRHN